MDDYRQKSDNGNELLISFDETGTAAETTWVQSVTLGELGIKETLHR